MQNGFGPARVSIAHLMNLERHEAVPKAARPPSHKRVAAMERFVHTNKSIETGFEGGILD